MAISEADLEALTHAYGEEIFARLDREGPVPLTPEWIDERLLAWTMHDETVKTQLFRFIDVLPQLRDPGEVSRHLREYFEEAHASLPGWARFAARWIPDDGFVSRWLARLARFNAHRLARKFIAGSTIDEALEAIAALRQRKLAFTVDLLGEACITEHEARQYQRAYLEMLHGLADEVNHWPEIPLIDRDDRGPIPRVNVSIKLSSLYSQFDPIDPEGTYRAVAERLRPILEEARQRRAFINFDMEQYAYKDLTLYIFKRILREDSLRDWPDVGIAIQAYLRDTERDLQDLTAWVRQRGTPVAVRLVKGAYWDYETIVAAQHHWPVPVFQNKWETDANYEKATRYLLEHHEYLRPAFGSHNVRSLAYALACARLMELPRGAMEIQLLYGMADPFMDALVSLHQRVRVYTPYGELLPGMAYLVRRLLENTANTSFMRASFTEHVPEDRLLMNPLQWAKRRSRSSDGTAEPPVFENEPVADFSREENRRAMREALAEVRSRFGLTYPLVIAGERIETANRLRSLNPSRTAEIVGECCLATTGHAEQAIAAALDAFPSWRDTSPEQRAEYLERVADAMRQRRFELAAWQIYECGKQWREADADVCEAIDFCRYYAQEMRRLAQPYRADVPGEENETFYIPRGVAVVIAPWNFPLAILTGMTTAALVTGNTVVMKPAEQSSVMAAKLMEIFEDVGLPAGVVNYLPGVGEEVGPVLVEHPQTAVIAFTGSKAVGLAINRQAAEQRPGQDHVKKVITEMGGKNAIIVDEDADLDEAVAGVVQSAFGYQGQKCSACSRVIVLEGIYNTFLQRLVEATRSLKIAPADDPACKVGPVIDEEAKNRILDYIAKGKEQADLVFAGDPGELTEQGYYIAPHIFANVEPGDVIAQEEIFGPVLAVMKAASLDEALYIANGTQYALTGGFYSRSPANIKKVRERFLVGNLYINRKITGALVGRQPFGGFKLSGIGSKAGGPDYLLQFLLPRTITENTMRRGFAPIESEPGVASGAPAPAQ